MNKKKNHKIDRKILFLISIFLVMMMSTYLYLKYLNGLMDENVFTNLDELVQQNADKLNIQIKNQMRFVDEMASTIEREQLESVEEILKRFEKDISRYQFTRLAVVYPDGTTYTNDGYQLNFVEEYSSFVNKDKVVISENRNSKVNEEKINTYTKAVTVHQKEFVIMASVETSTYQNILSKKIYGGLGHTYVINASGDVIIDSTNGQMENVFSSMDSLENKKKLEEMIDTISNGTSGNIIFRNHAKKYYVSFDRIDINDWNILLVIPNDIIANQIQKFLLYTFLICISVIFLILFAFFYIFKEEAKKKKELFKLAYFDKLTEIGNYHYFLENTKKSLERNHQNSYLILLDINKFKVINQKFGYEAGNQVLRKIADKLKEMFPEKAVIARLANDTFALLLNLEQDIEIFLIDMINQLEKIKENEMNISFALGVYPVQNEDKEITLMIDKALLAQKKIKGNYAKNYYIYDSSLEQNLIEEQEIEAKMESALNNGEFKIYYQPKIDLKENKIIGAEALVRWQEGEKIIPPNHFIPLFEKNRFIIKLDNYIFEKVCQDLNEWNKNNFYPKISVNISREHFSDPYFMLQYRKIAQRYEVNVEDVEIEITESAAIEEEVVLEMLSKIHLEGFKIAIDDFGKGFSSLNMLDHLQIDVLKIDKSFIDKIGNGKREKASIVRHIIQIAKEKHIITVAEGIEKKEQVTYLKKLGCDLVQGYYFSKPLKKEAFETYMKKTVI